MKNLGEIFRLPKWAKISLVALSVVAIALLISVFALQKWADSQVESANLSFSKIDKAKSADLESGYAYEARVHFARLDFLLRSRTISHIDLEKVAWASGVDSSAIQSIETHNRRLNFTTTQQLNLDSGANLGTMSYKMDFSPLPMAITWYYLCVVFAVLFASLTLSFIKAQSGATLGGGGTHLCVKSYAISVPNLPNLPLCFTLPTIFHTQFHISHAKR